jgi:hypothetical protein
MTQRDLIKIENDTEKTNCRWRSKYSEAHKKFYITNKGIIELDRLKKFIGGINEGRQS